MYGKKQIQEDFCFQGPPGALVGRPAIEALDLVSRVNTIEPPTVLKKFPQSFQGLGTIEGEYHIKLHDGAIPYAQTTLKWVAFPLKPKVKAHATGANGEDGSYLTCGETNWLVHCHGCSAKTWQPSPYLRGSHKTQRECTRETPLAIGGTNPRAACRSKNFHQTGCKPGVLANSIFIWVIFAHNLHHSVWTFLFQPTSIWYHFSSRAFSETYVWDLSGHRRGRVYGQRHPRERKHINAVWSTTGDRSGQTCKSKGYSECRWICFLTIISSLFGTDCWCWWHPSRSTLGWV